MPELSSLPGSGPLARLPSPGGGAPRGAPRCAEDLRALALFAGVNANALQHIFESIEIRSLRARTLTLVENEARQNAMLLWSGACRLFAIAPNGATVVVQIAKAGEALPLGAVLTGGEPLCGLRINATETARLLLAPIGALNAAAQACPRLSANLIATLGAQQQHSAWQFFELATLDMRARLIAHLLRLGQEEGKIEAGGVVIRGGRTQREIAEEVGAAREGIARQLATLVQERLITRERDRIVLTNLRELLEAYYGATGRILPAYEPGGRLASALLAQGGILAERGRHAS